MFQNFYPRYDKQSIKKKKFYLDVSPPPLLLWVLCKMEYIKWFIYQVLFNHAFNFSKIIRSSLVKKKDISRYTN